MKGKCEACGTIGYFMERNARGRILCSDPFWCMDQLEAKGGLP